MIKLTFIKSCLIALLVLGIDGALAQNELMLPPEMCSLMISEAESLYNSGNYESCAEKLEKVLKSCKLTRISKERVMELRAKCYVEIRDQEKANVSVEGLLMKFPHYELHENENYESYNRLVKKYKVHPLLSVGARNVIIWIGYNTSNLADMPDGVLATSPYNGGNYFFSYYGWAEIEFDNNVSLNGDLMWWTSYFEKSYTKEPDYDLFYSENPIFVEIPVYAKKYFPVGLNLKPYLAAGAGWLYMTKATGYASRYDRNEKIRYWDSDIDVLDMRNRNNFEWIAGAGIGYKLKSVRLFFDARVYGGLTSITDTKNRFSNELLMNEYYYVDSPLKLNKFEVGVSISYTFLNSVKRIK